MSRGGRTLLMTAVRGLAAAVCLGQPAQVDLSLGIVSAPSSVTVGNPTSYGFSVTVPSATTGVYVTVVFQPAVQFNASAPSSAGCVANQATNDASTTMTCPSSGASGTTTVTVNVTPLSVGTLRVVAGVIGADFDPSPANNSVNATTAVNPGPPVVTSLTANPAPPEPTGTTITWTITATGGVAPLQYAFYLYSAASASWSLGRAYSTSNSWAWTPTQAGQYALQVWVRNNGSVATYDAWKGSDFFNIGTSSPPPTITSLAASPTLPRPVGTTITWTITATGGVAPLQYAFYLYSAASGSWSLGRAYSTSNSWSWTPTQAGQYSVQVWVRNNGSPEALDAYTGLNNFTITP